MSDLVHILKESQDAKLAAAEARAEKAERERDEAIDCADHAIEIARAAEGNRGAIAEARAERYRKALAELVDLYDERTGAFHEGHADAAWEAARAALRGEG